MKRIIKTHFKLFIFLFGISLLLVNCEKDEDYQTDIDQIQQVASTSYRVISLEKIPKLDEVVQNIKSIQPITQDYSSKDFSFLNNFENINTNEIIEYTNETGYTTFSFKFNTTETSINFENLHLLETEDGGYIAYVLSYQPNEDWYYEHLNIDGSLNFDISTYQGEITKYSLEREVIWTTNSETTSKGNSSTQARGTYAFTICIVSPAPPCDEGNHGPGNWSGCRYSNGISTESCQTFFGGGGGGFYDDPNDYDDNGGGSYTGPNGEPCNDTSGTAITPDNEPIDGVTTDCTPNNNNGVSNTNAYFAFWQDLSYEQQDYLNYHPIVKSNLIAYLNQNQHSPKAASFGKRAIDILKGVSDVNTLTTIFEHKSFVGLTGDILTNNNAQVFTEHSLAFNDVDPLNILSVTDWAIVSLKALEIYQILPSYAISTIIDPTGLSVEHQNLIASNSAFIAFLPQVKSLVGEHWPQTSEEWSAIGTIMGQYMLEIGLAVIPGSSIIEVVSGVNDGDYMLVTIGIVGLVVDAFGGTIIKIIGKIGKVAYKTFKIFKLVFKYLNEVVKTIQTGFKTLLDGNTVKILDDFDNLIAKITNNILTFKYTGFGGDIITNPTKTTTVLGRYIDDTGKGTKKVLDSDLYKYGENTGGLNLLDEPNWNNLSTAQQDILNKNWLEQAFIRGDDIRLISNPNTNTFIQNTNNFTQFGKELSWIDDFLDIYNYSFNSTLNTYIKN